MIRKIFIIQRSGECIYYLNLALLENGNVTSKASDPQIISRFFAAIVAFGDSQTGSPVNTNLDSKFESKREKMNFICFKNLNYYFQQFGTYFIVFELDLNNSIPDKDILSLMHELNSLYEQFIEKGTTWKTEIELNMPTEFENAIRDKVALIYRRSLLKGLIRQ